MPWDSPAGGKEMEAKPEPSNLEVLAGLIERVTYHNEENGFCVLRIKARGHRELVTVVEREQ
jgi:exodeoxyribonuclease V alpha subunit